MASKRTLGLRSAVPLILLLGVPKASGVAPMEGTALRLQSALEPGAASDERAAPSGLTDSHTEQMNFSNATVMQSTSVSEEVLRSGSRVNHVHNSASVPYVVESPDWWIAPGHIHVGHAAWSVPLALSVICLTIAIFRARATAPGPNSPLAGSSGRADGVEPPQTVEDAKGGSAALEEKSIADTAAVPMAKPRIGWFDNIKFYAIICVAIDHAILYTKKTLAHGGVSYVDFDKNGIIGFIEAFVIKPAMPLFFLAAGAVRHCLTFLCTASPRPSPRQHAHF